MSAIKELISKGVRIVGAAGAPGSPNAGDLDIPPGTFAAAVPSTLTRSTLPADISDWDAVYREAGVQTPRHGYGVDRVAEMLEAKRFGALDRDTKRNAILAALDAAGVAIRDVIQDAVMRDEVLEAFEQAKQREVEDQRGRTEGRIQTIEQEMETALRETNTELDNLKRTAEEAARAFAQFQDRKRREEQRLRDVLGHFLSDAENPIRPSDPAKTARA
jgi:hypothetical protein